MLRWHYPENALDTYREKPTEERFKYVVRAVLVALKENPDEWERHAPMVKAVVG